MSGTSATDENQITWQHTSGTPVNGGAIANLLVRSMRQPQTYLPKRSHREPRAVESVRPLSTPNVGIPDLCKRICNYPPDVTAQLWTTHRWRAAGHQLQYRIPTVRHPVLIGFGKHR